MENIKTQKFSKDFLKEFMTDKKVDKGKEITDFDLKEVVRKDDGGLILTAEEYWVTVVTTYSSRGMSHTTYHYHYGDIIVLNIDAEGKMIWSRKIAKSQHSINDGGFFSSYYLAVVKDNLYFIFNDSEKNYTKDKDYVYTFERSNSNKGVVSNVRVDSDGEIDKRQVYAIGDEEIILRPKVCQQISDNEVLLFCEKAKRQRYAKIHFR